MKKNQTIRLALDMLEKEMEILSIAETLNFLGGDDVGDPNAPLPDGYCTFNNAAGIASLMGATYANPSNVLGNYVNTYGTGAFAFGNDGNNNTVVGCGTAGDNGTDKLLDSMFNTSTITSGATGIASAIQNGQVVSISSAGAEGHAYTITNYDENTGIFTFHDYTTNKNIAIQNNSNNMSQFVNPKAITGLKIPTTGNGATANWDQGLSQSSVDNPCIPPPALSGGGSTGG